MTDTAQHLVDMIQRRMNNKFGVLNSLQTSALEQVSSEVTMMREIEAKSVRAVMQEQADIIDIINALFPKVKVSPLPPITMVDIPDDELKKISVKKVPAKKVKRKPNAGN